MSDEIERPKRRRIDQMRLRDGDRLRVYFPGGAQPRVLVATGRRDDESEVHEMRSEDGRTTEWVPGWLVATQLGRRA